ncbi:MAG TPA: YIP1 family protein [Pyrinomonadaceae bacterium]|nr:YIP1 family protein [Pyrinomonadaceae bacterium]
MSDMNTPMPPSDSTGAPTAHVSPHTADAATMSTPETLSGIFFEPARTFEALRARPRFLIAGIITILAFMAFYILFVQKLGAETIARAQIESRSPDMAPEQLEQALSIQRNPMVQAITYASFPLVFALIFAAGGGLYLLGSMAMAKSMSYKQAVSVWVYSTLPPTLVFSLVNILLLFLKSKEDIDPAAVNQGLARANLALLVNPKEQPVLATVLGSFDLFQFYGLFLAVLGLRKIARLSSGAAWGIVLLIWAVGLLVRVGMSAAFGQAY